MRSPIPRHCCLGAFSHERSLAEPITLDLSLEDSHLRHLHPRTPLAKGRSLGSSALELSLMIITYVGSLTQDCSVKAQFDILAWGILNGRLICNCTLEACFEELGLDVLFVSTVAS